MTKQPHTPATPLANAFQWMNDQVRQRIRPSVPRLIEIVVRLFALSPAQAQWLKWTLDPQAVAVAPKEPDSTLR